MKINTKFNNALEALLKNAVEEIKPILQHEQPKPKEKPKEKKVEPVIEVLDATNVFRMEYMAKRMLLKNKRR